MQDFLRERLTEEELEQYETYDAIAVICSQFVVWPALIGLICFATGQSSIAYGCWIIALIALPFMLSVGQKARALLKVAEERYISIMEGGGGYQPPY
jgi:hypothetical protein